VSIHLVEDDRGVTVVDAGLSGQWPDLIAELETMGRSVEDVRGVVLTHGDIDHLGFAERLRAQGVPVYIHEADAAQARGEAPKQNPPWGRFKIGPMLGFLWYAGRRGGMKVTPVEEVVTISDEQTLDLPGNPRVIHIPGHSPGSVAFHSPSVGALFVGDALTTRHVLTGETGPQPAPFTLDPERAMDSLGRLEPIEADWLLPGHGPPWTGGVADAIRQIRQFAG
jgi:glyoxylase-like metal-dependent hydrolase (beta-lactamase superfamily II)